MFFKLDFSLLVSKEEKATLQEISLLVSPEIVPGNMEKKKEAPKKVAKKQIFCG